MYLKYTIFNEHIFYITIMKNGFEWMIQWLTRIGYFTHLLD